MSVPVESSLSEAESSIFRKKGWILRLRREVEAMEYVRRHTSIPIPQVFGTHFIETQLDDTYNESWIDMSRIPGQQLGQAWKPMLPASQARTIAELKSHLAELHHLQSPQSPNKISSCSGGPAYDHRINNMATVGPFQSVSDFHDFLVAPIRQCPKPELVNKYRKLLPDEYRVRFVHADISWENIMVDPSTGAVTGVLDWEMAGFWPEWWEFRKALFGARSKPWWVEITRQILPNYFKETEADMDIEMF